MMSIRRTISTLFLAMAFAGCATTPFVEPNLIDNQTLDETIETLSPEPSDTPVKLPPVWTSTPSPTGQPATNTPLPHTIISSPEPLEALQTLTLEPSQIITPITVNQNWSGWKWIESNHARLRVPDSYEVFDLGQGMGDLMEAMMQGLVEGFEDTFEGFEEFTGEEIEIEPTQMGFTSEELEGAFDFDFLIAFDDDFMTSVVLASEPSTLTLEFAMQQSLQQVEGEYRVLARQIIKDAPYETGRLIVEVYDPELDMEGKQLLYIFIHDGQAYTLGYQTLSSAFERLLPVFERSASTFEIK